MLNCFSSDFYYYSKHTQKLSRTEFLEQVLNFIFKWTLDSRNRNINFTDLEKYIEMGKNDRNSYSKNRSWRDICESERRTHEK